MARSTSRWSAGPGCVNAVIDGSTLECGSGTPVATADGCNGIALVSATLSTGINSIAVGPAAARKAGGLALGAYSEAISIDSAAIGNAVTATGENTVVMNSTGITNGRSAVAIGHAALATGTKSLAFSSQSQSTGQGTEEHIPLLHVHAVCWNRLQAGTDFQLVYFDPTYFQLSTTPLLCLI